MYKNILLSIRANSLISCGLSVPTNSFGLTKEAIVSLEKLALSTLVPKAHKQEPVLYNS